MVPWSLTMSAHMWRDLQDHLFPGDGDEHGAVIAAGVVRTCRGARLLARELHTAADGTDYLPGERGYRMLTPSFVRDRILDCAREGLSYLAVHNHGGADAVGFSADDMASHERGYPALRDIADGNVVGALVFARNAVAGDLWLPDGERASLESLRVVGSSIRTLHPAPPEHPPDADITYDRQARIFGDRGQAVLRRQKVGVIGAGGIGSLVVEYLARLGVGHLVVADPDRIDTSNLSRLVGSTRRDALTWFTDPRRPSVVRKVGQRFAKRKVHVARRVARAANPKIRFEAVVGDIAEDAVARRFIDCDYLFLAADSMQARLVFNALVHQYLLPGIQMGAKVTVDEVTGQIDDVFSVVRPVQPHSGCLWCNGLISPAQLQDEAFTEDQRRRQRYVEGEAITAPSVITLNSVAAAHAVDTYLFQVTGLSDDFPVRPYLRFTPRSNDVVFEAPRSDARCLECGATARSRLSRGDSRRLPTR